MHSLQELYIQQLRDIYDAEKQLVKALPQMADVATSPVLEKAFHHHHEQTQHHVQRLERVFGNMQMPGNGASCNAMRGLIKEGEEIMHKDSEAAVKDAALIAAAQRVEHYEIAAYGTVCAFAEELGDTNNLQLLQETLKEEKKTDAKLTDIANRAMNPHARNRDIDLETVIALYDDFTKARAAIEELDQAGISRRRLSIIANDNDERYTKYIRHMEHRDQSEPDADEGAGFGAVVGTLSGLGVAVIPGLGGFVVAGLAGAALFAGIGAAVGGGLGGLTAGLVDLGVDRDTAESYSRRLHDGGAMVIAHVDEDWEDRVEAIMKKHNSIDVEDVDRR